MKKIVLPAVLLLTTPCSIHPLWAAEDLTPASAFQNIPDDHQRSLKLFEEMAKVLTSPRCLNCHPVKGGPTQGDDMHPHNPPMVRGDGDFGPPGMHCSTCHGSQNVDFAGISGSIPGHEPWQLAPVSMGWQGLSIGEICRSIKDPNHNGDRTLEELITHHSEDGLVGWAWHPGAGRTPAPGTQVQFGELTRAWVETGAACPD
ncbi:hypothetical protein [Thalassospira marina]|uniref:hypothetical protein n=1 Tax=Thalassospira marina TaxID=2048283 RepID=UPI001C06A44E|nr:hypothetical protein [Thalassospira marina]